MRNQDFEMYTKERELHQKEREVLFSNESFAIGVLQAVSGGALFAGFSQSATLIWLAGRIAFLTFTSMMGFALIAAVLSAYCKHEYKKWDVKARASESSGNHPEAQIRSRFSSFHLALMRGAMAGALVAFTVALTVLLSSAWMHVTAAPQPSPHYAND